MSYKLRKIYLVSILSLPLITCMVMLSHLTSLWLSLLICKMGLPLAPAAYLLTSAVPLTLSLPRCAEGGPGEHEGNSLLS